MNKGLRIVLFILSMLTLLVVVLSSGNFFQDETTKSIIISCLIMMAFVALLVEHFFTKPADVLATATSILLLLSPIKNNLSKFGIWFDIIFFYNLVFALIALSSILLLQREQSEKSIRNIVAEYLKVFCLKFATSKYLYFFVLISTMLFYTDKQNEYFIIIFLFSIIVLMIEPEKMFLSFSAGRKKDKGELVGEIFGVQSKKIFLVKLYENKKNVNKFDIVKFNYSMQESDDRIIEGIVFDTYLLNKEKWAKVLQLATTMKKDFKIEKNIVCKITEPQEKELLMSQLKIENFVGIVIEDSHIGKIKFEYSKLIDNLQEGDLLELTVGEKRLFYQTVAGTTEKERLEAENESDFITGEAVQLGEWQNDKLSFKKFGWVPCINTPIFKADTRDIPITQYSYPLFKLGMIPNTSLPSVIDLKDAISHHLALLGITGSGKSFLAREIIRELKIDTKVICIDLTGEWKDKLADLTPNILFDSSRLAEVERLLVEKETQARGRNNSEVLRYKKIIQERLNHYIREFADSDNNITVFELPDLSNTSFILEFTQMFLEGVFIHAKQNHGKSFCLVLEEAHTIIPETTFLGDLGDYGSNKGLVSKMGQIALQGRKYGVGIIILAQRTANVSKTVLTQCNTVICFQAFDETSFAFLGNYVGKDMVQTLPNLKQYHAVVSGKALKSNTPVIVDLTRNADTEA